MQSKLMHEYFQKGIKEKTKNTVTVNSMALLHFIKASYLRHPEATATLGNIFLYKLFGEQNYELAMQYYQKAINLNTPKGYEAMGMLYHDGDGVERSFRTAYKYYLNSNTYISHLNKSIIESIHYDEVKDLIPLQNLKLEKNECSECQSSIDTYIG